MMEEKKTLSPEDKKMMRSVFWRSWTMNASRTGATQYHALGVIYTLLPVINRFYKTDAERAEAIVRHATWFNATMHINNFIMGLVAAMEKQNSEDKNFDTNSITAIKASLMGPISCVSWLPASVSLWQVQARRSAHSSSCCSTTYRLSSSTIMR